jgi:tricarballylate dehydrogenase
MARKETCDVAIVGGGSAAFEAAVSAHQNGAERIIMLEKAPEEEFGGNARYSHTGFRFAYEGVDDLKYIAPDADPVRMEKFHVPPYTNERFLADLNRVTQGRIDPELAGFMVEQSNSAVRWMFESGMEFEPEKAREIDGRLHFEPGIIAHTVGGGLGQLLRWRRIAEGLGVELRCQSRVRGFLGDFCGVEGVEVSTPDEDYELHAGAVIVCAGGFQANAEMRARYLGANADLMKVRGSKHNTGEVLRMLLDMGVKPAGHWQGAHATPIDRNAPDGGTPLRQDGHGNTCNRYDYPYGITVNALGERFYDEGESNHSYTYAKTGRALLAQPGGTAHQIYDKKSLAMFRLGAEYTDTYESADTIPELAEKIGLDPAALEATVSEFNAACRTDVEFDPTTLDGKSTIGLTPDKSNWAQPIDTPPFRAYPITCGVTFSFGGVRIDTKTQVLDITDRPIKSLFASGDIVGLFFHNYPSCTGQTRNAVFSREAGKNAALMCN